MGISFSALVVFFALLWKHHETKLRIKMGTYEAPQINLKNFSLFLGLCLVGIGAVLSVMFMLLEGLSWGLLGGLIPLVIGAMLLIFNKISKN